MPSKKTTLFMCFVAGVILAGCSGEAQSDYQTYVIRPAINNDPILADEALPVQCRDETVMKVMCARGECEPASVDIAELKQEWGDRLAFAGNTDMDMLSRGTSEQIVQATRYLIEKVAPGGGYAMGSGNSLSKYVSVANYKAMLDTVCKYGQIY